MARLDRSRQMGLDLFGVIGCAADEGSSGNTDRPARTHRSAASPTGILKPGESVIAMEGNYCGDRIGVHPSGDMALCGKHRQRWQSPRQVAP